MWYNTDWKRKGHTALWCVVPRAHVQIPLTLHHYTVEYLQVKHSYQIRQSQINKEGGAATGQPPRLALGHIVTDQPRSTQVHEPG